jgi:diguanylate cyclase (GGDEF)-like protein
MTMSMSMSMSMNSTPTSKLVLVVDDDPTTRLMASARLGSAGFQIAEAANGSCALESLQSRRPDLVLLDVDMPGMDGFAACKRIREREDCANLPILMMTGLDDVESIEQAFTAGATDFATKPINWALTIRRIRYLLRANRMLSDLEHAAVAISRGQRMLDGAERLARMGSWEWDPAENRLQLSQGLELLWGCTSSGGQHTLETVLERVSDADRDAVRDAIDDALSGIGRDVHHEIRSGDGLLHHIQHRMEPVVDEDSGRVTLRAIALDVTEQHIADEKIRRLAYFDGLTGLPNRESFKDRLGQEVERARRQQGLLATLFLDLDEFKRINDTLGHAAGDQLLRQVATRLQESVRSGDLVGRGPVNGADGAVARLGGDEFTLLVSEMKNPQDAARVAKRILESLSRPVAVGGQDVVVSPSIGIAVYPQDGTDAQTLLECADTAMYFAKRAGKNVFRFYDASMSEAARRRLIMEHQADGARPR